MRASYQTMNALATHTKLEPRARIERLMSFNRRLLNEPKIAEELNDWGLKLDNKLVQLPGHVIPKDKIIMANGNTLTPKGNNWDGEVRSIFATNPPPPPPHFILLEGCVCREHYSLSGRLLTRFPPCHDSPTTLRDKSSSSSSRLYTLTDTNTQTNERQVPTWPRTFFRLIFREIISFFSSNKWALCILNCSPLYEN